MRFQRDPRDRRYPERLAGSFLASLIFHALLAVLLFSVLVSSSELGTNENVEGGEIVTIERAAPVAVANQPAAQHEAAPVPHVPRIAPIRHAAPTQPRTQRLPTNRHELAVAAPTAPPNPRPVPQQSLEPNPQPTENIFEAQPKSEAPAAPVNVPTVVPVAVAIKTPPTAAPSPAPTSAPKAKSSPRPPMPSAPPSAKPATPAPVGPRPSPTAAALARTSAAPSASPAAAPHASAPPAPRSGVPNPSPTNAAAVARTPGTAPSPGPTSGASPGPRQEGGTKNQSTPQRPIELRPTPAPASPAPKSRTAPNINDKLRSLLPNNPVHPASKQYTPTISLHGRLEPTPPPDVLEKTKYLYEVRRTGNELSVKMWVTAAHKEGPTTICTGWLVRYPQPERGGYAPLPSNVQANSGTPNGTQISIGGGGQAHEPLSPFDAGIAPIVDGMVTQACDGRLLTPYAPSAAPSP